MRLSLLASRIVRRRRRGLTLMELVVVMVILIALAGILLPLFPSMLTRAHTSTSATNMSELSKSISTYMATELQLPYNLDNLAPLVASGNVSPVNANATLIAAYPGGTATAVDLIAQAANANDVTALANGGMNSFLQTTVVTTTPTSWTPTYNPYSTNAITSATLPTATVATAISPTAATLPTLMFVSPTAVARELGYPAIAAARFVMFGVGDYSSLSGTVMQQAPIHFDDSALGEPNVAYCRFGAIFATTLDGSGTDLPQAKFMGVVDLGDPSGITSIGDHVQGYLNTK